MAEFIETDRERHAGIRRGYSTGQPAKLSYMGNALIENRNGLRYWVG